MYHGVKMIKIKINDILKSIEKIKSISGRLEKVGYIKNNSKVILDYAHTPEALKTAILNIDLIYPQKSAKKIFFFGFDKEI